MTDDPCPKSNLASGRVIDAIEFFVSAALFYIKRNDLEVEMAGRLGPYADRKVFFVAFADRGRFRLEYSSRAALRIPPIDNR